MPPSIADICVSLLLLATMDNVSKHPMKARHPVKVYVYDQDRDLHFLSVLAVLVVCSRATIAWICREHFIILILASTLKFYHTFLGSSVFENAKREKEKTVFDNFIILPFPLFFFPPL